MIFYAKSIGMKLMPDNQRAWLDYLLSVDGKKLVVEIERETGVRSDSQNRTYWMRLELIANHTGHSAEELHQLFKRLYLPPKFKKILGRDLKLPSSTTGLNKSEFSEYMMKIEAEATSLGIVLPEIVKDIAPLK
jgi:hypothetical protein